MIEKVAEDDPAGKPPTVVNKKMERLSDHGSTMLTTGSYGEASGARERPHTPTFL